MAESKKSVCEVSFKMSRSSESLRLAVCLSPPLLLCFSLSQAPPTRQPCHPQVHVSHPTYFHFLLLGGLSKLQDSSDHAPTLDRITVVRNISHRLIDQTQTSKPLFRAKTEWAIYWHRGIDLGKEIPQMKTKAWVWKKNYVGQAKPGTEPIRSCTAKSFTVSFWP